MTKKAESRLQLKIRKYLQEKYGGFWFKVHGGPFQRAGIPDLYGIVQGRSFFIEVKTPDGKPPSKLQVFTLNRLYEAGSNVAVVTSVDEATRFVKKCLRNPSTPIKPKRLNIPSLDEL